MTGARRVTVVVLAAATAASLLGDMMLYTVLPSQHVLLGIGVAGLGVLLSVHRFIRLVANSVVGVLCDRFGRRRPFLLGTGLAVVSTLGYVLAWGFWPLLGARLVWGVAFALISVGGLSILMDVTTPADRGRTVGVYHSLVQVGTLAALVASGILADLVGFRPTLAAFAAVSALGAVLAALALEETRPPGARGIAAMPGEGGAASLGRSAGAELRGLLGTYRRADSRLLALGYVSFIAFFAGNGVLMATLGAHVKAELGGAPGAALVPLATLTGILLGARKLGAMLMAPVAGALSDRLADRRRVARAGIVTALAGFVILATGGGAAGIVVGVALTAVGEGILLPTLVAGTGDMAPAALRAVFMAGLATASDLGGALGPLAGYAVGAAFGLRWAYGGCVLLLLSAFLALTLAGAPGERAVEELPLRSG